MQNSQNTYPVKCSDDVGKSLLEISVAVAKIGEKVEAHTDTLKEIKFRAIKVDDSIEEISTTIHNLALTVQDIKTKQNIASGIGGIIGGGVISLVLWGLERLGK